MPEQIEIIERGTPVRFTADALGVLDPASPMAFLEDVKIERGERGRYQEHKPIGDQHNWHLCTVERSDEEGLQILVVPVHRLQFSLDVDEQLFIGTLYAGGPMPSARTRGRDVDELSEWIAEEGYPQHDLGSLEDVCATASELGSPHKFDIEDGVFVEVQAHAEPSDQPGA